jgi:hypothetical protein
MPTPFEMGRRWLERQHFDVLIAIDAALELCTQMRPTLATNTIAPCDLFEKDPLMGKRWAEQAGLASIAGRRDLEEQQVLDTLYFLMSVAPDMVNVP